MKIASGVLGVDELRRLYPFIDDHDWALAQQYENITIDGVQYPFIDSAATIPVTEVGDPVGFSRGLVGTPPAVQTADADRPVWGEDGIVTTDSDGFDTEQAVSFFGVDVVTAVAVVTPSSLDVISGIFRAQGNNFLLTMRNIAGGAFRSRLDIGGTTYLLAEDDVFSVGDRIVVATEWDFALGEMRLFVNGTQVASRTTEVTPAPDVDVLLRIGRVFSDNFLGTIESFWVSRSADAKDISEQLL